MLANLTNTARYTCTQISPESLSTSVSNDFPPVHLNFCIAPTHGFCLESAAELANTTLTVSSSSQRTRQNCCALVLLFPRFGIVRVVSGSSSDKESLRQVAELASWRDHWQVRVSSNVA